MSEPRLDVHRARSLSPEDFPGVDFSYWTEGENILKYVPVRQNKQGLDLNRYGYPIHNAKYEVWKKAQAREGEIVSRERWPTIQVTLTLELGALVDALGHVGVRIEPRVVDR